jgi:hypothetical protein
MVRIAATMSAPSCAIAWCSACVAAGHPSRQRMVLAPGQHATERGWHMAPRHVRRAKGAMKAIARAEDRWREALGAKRGDGHADR